MAVRRLLTGLNWLVIRVYTWLFWFYLALCVFLALKGGGWDPFVTYGPSMFLFFVIGVVRNRGSRIDSYLWTIRGVLDKMRYHPRRRIDRAE